MTKQERREKLVEAQKALMEQRKQISRNIWATQGAILLIDEQIAEEAKCEANSGMEATIEAGCPPTPSTGLQENHGSHATSATSASRARKPSGTTETIN